MKNSACAMDINCENCILKQGGETRKFGILSHVIKFSRVVGLK